MNAMRTFRATPGLDRLGKIVSGDVEFTWSREAADEVFGHVMVNNVFVKGSAGFWATKCPVTAARRAGLWDVQGPEFK